MTALITGASKGIGKELVIEFAKNNIDVILVARSQKLLHDLAQFAEDQYGINTYVFDIDLSEQNAAEELYHAVNKKELTVHYLVNNAGFGDYGEFANSDLKKQSDMINLNVLTLTNLTHLFVQDMKKRKQGKILNLASVASFKPGPTMSVYFATKNYVLSFSEAIYEELKPYNIQVTALCPGPTESEFGKVAGFKILDGSKKSSFPSSKEVAQFGFKKMMKGKDIAIHGFVNTTLTTLTRFAPRSVVRKIVRYRIK